MGGQDGVAVERAGVVARGLVVGILCLAALAGCAKPKTGDPRLDLEQVQGFSLGSAKFKPFKKRPTAKDLYERMYALYDSFHTLAVSHDTGIREGRWTVGKRHSEFRFRKPCKWYALESNGWLCIDNGRKHLEYDVTSGTYWPVQRTGYSLVWMPHNWSPMLQWFDSAGRSLKLLADTAVGGVPVYVLEDNLSTKSSSMRTRLYVGKRDLLLRKAVTMNYSGSGPLRHLDTTETVVFRGIRANVPIPNKLFSTRLPAGSRPMKKVGPGHYTTQLSPWERVRFW